MTENTLWVFAVILLFGLIVPEFFKKIQLPFATSLILVGAFLGPQGFDYVELDPSMELFGYLGAAFLMLLAGLEVKSDFLKKSKDDIGKLLVLNAGIPFISGVIITKLFGYGWSTAVVTGILFMSSSTPLIFSQIRFKQLDQTRLGRTLKSTVVLEDMASLLFLSILIQYTDPESRFSPPVYLGLLISSVILLRMFLPEVVLYFFKKFQSERDVYEERLRVVLAFFLMVLILYSAMNIHPIIAAFVVGFVLSEVEGVQALKQKLHTIGYGVFVPIFFFIIGIETDFRVFSQLDLSNMLLIILLLGAFFSKMISGYIGARWEGFPKSESKFMAVATTTKLTTTISTSYAALLLDLIDPPILTAMVVITVLSTVLGPIFMNLVSRKISIIATS